MDIVLENITKSYGNRMILNRICCTFHSGEMVAVVGPSGCGKSSLLNIIGLVEHFDKGGLKFGDIEVCKLSGNTVLKIRRKYIGYIFQNYALLDDLTVEDNLKVALRYNNVRNKQEQIGKAMEEVALPISVLKQKVFELSGGEQQRVAIARTILKPCEIVLADEPTGALDTINKDKIVRLLKKINLSGKTILIATHDKEIAGICDTVIDLKCGSFTKNGMR